MDPRQASPGTCCERTCRHTARTWVCACEEGLRCLRGAPRVASARVPDRAHGGARGDWKTLPWRGSRQRLASQDGACQWLDVPAPARVTAEVDYRRPDHVRVVVVLRLEPPVPCTTRKQNVKIESRPLRPEDSQGQRGSWGAGAARRGAGGRGAFARTPR